MGIPRDLVQLEAVLRIGELADPFASVSHGGLVESPAARSMIERIRRAGFYDPVRVMRLCLQALRIQHEEIAPTLVETELVATLPPEMPGIARTTGQVLREMLRPPVEEVILLGYEVTDQDMMRLIMEVEATGAEVIMICDRTRGTAQRVLNVGLQRS